MNTRKGFVALQYLRGASSLLRSLGTGFAFDMDILVLSRSELTRLLAPGEATNHLIGFVVADCTPVFRSMAVKLSP